MKTQNPIAPQHSLRVEYYYNTVSLEKWPRVEYIGANDDNNKVESMGKKSGGVRIKQVGGMKPPSKAALASMMQPPKLEDFMVAPEEQISLPPSMNKKYQMFYPIHETFTMQTDTFQIIYPSYIDPTKTIQQGRRVPLHLLTTSGNGNHDGLTQDVIHTNNMIVELDGKTGGERENNHILLSPTIQEISQALQSLNIRHVVQPYKCYPRSDQYENPGRCLVDINKGQYKNKVGLLMVIAKQIQLLPSRPQRIEQERIRQIEFQEKILQSITTAATNGQHRELTTSGPSSNTTVTTNKKKSSKKKK